MINTSLTSEDIIAEAVDVCVKVLDAPIEYYKKESSQPPLKPDQMLIWRQALEETVLLREAAVMYCHIQNNANSTDLIRRDAAIQIAMLFITRLYSDRLESFLALKQQSHQRALSTREMQQLKQNEEEIATLRQQHKKIRTCRLARE